MKFSWYAVSAAGLRLINEDYYDRFDATTNLRNRGAVVGAIGRDGVAVWSEQPRADRTLQIVENGTNAAWTGAAADELPNFYKPQTSVFSSPAPQSLATVWSSSADPTVSTSRRLSITGRIGPGAWAKAYTADINGLSLQLFEYRETTTRSWVFGAVPSNGVEPVVFPAGYLPVLLWR